MSQYGSEWNYLCSEEDHVEGLEMFLADGTALNVIRYIDNFSSSSEWSWMIRKPSFERWDITASYDDDVYYDDIDEAYTALMDFLVEYSPDLLPSEHRSAPGRARLSFMQKAVSLGFAASLALASFIPLAAPAYAGENSPVSLEVVAIEDTDQALYTIHECGCDARYYVGDAQALEQNISDTARQQAEVDGLCRALGFTGAAYEIGEGVMTSQGDGTLWVETSGGLRFSVLSPELSWRVSQKEEASGCDWIPFTSFTVPSTFASALDWAIDDYGMELVEAEMIDGQSEEQDGDARGLMAVGAFAAWGAVYAFFVRKSVNDEKINGASHVRRGRHAR